MKNIEIKARIRDLEDFGARLKTLKPEKPRVLVQEDVFFKRPQRPAQAPDPRAAVPGS